MLLCFACSFVTIRDQRGMTGTSTRDDEFWKLKGQPIGCPLCVFMFSIVMFLPIGSPGSIKDQRGWILETGGGGNL